MKFAYSSVASLRSFGIPASKVSDTRAPILIQEASAKINRLVESWFGPVLITKVLPYKPLIKLPLPPAIKISSMTLTITDMPDVVLSSTDYQISDEIMNSNLIRFMDSVLTVPGLPLLDGVIFGNPNYQIFDAPNFEVYDAYYGPNSLTGPQVAITGYFGIMDSTKAVTVTTSTIIQSGTVTIVVDDASKLEQKDYFVIGNRSFIINNINYTTNVISIDDPGNIPPIPIGTVFTVYGNIPSLIEKATNLLVKHDSAINNQFGGRIIGERTDNYQYDMKPVGGNSTGVPEVDFILNGYLANRFSIDFL